MKAFGIAVVGLVVVAVGASYVLAELREPSSERYMMDDVRLDPDMRSDGRYSE